MTPLTGPLIRVTIGIQRVKQPITRFSSRIFLRKAKYIMAESKRSAFKDEVEQAVMNSLLRQAHTIRELEKITSFNYYTIRNTVHKFEEQGLVKARGFRRNARVWGLPRDSDTPSPNNSIPSAVGPTGLPLKVTAILNFVGKEDTMTSLMAAKNLPMNLARILMTALRANAFPTGHEGVQDQLNNLRLEMENSLKSLQTTVRLYETLLSSKVLWDADLIKVVPYDVDFDEQQVTSAYHHYFPNT